MLKKQSKIRILFPLLFPLLTLLSGCEFKDIDKIVFVSIMGIDKSDDSDKPYKVTLKLYIPTGSFKQSPSPEYVYLTKNGETLSEAIRMLKTDSDKKLDFGHLKLIVIGEELLNANKGKEILDFLARRPDIQLISWVAVGRPSAEEILKITPKDEKAAYPTLFNYFDDDGTESPYIVTTFLFDFQRRMLEHGTDPIFPIIETSQDKSQFEINKSLVLAHKKTPHELSSLNTLIFNMLTKNLDLMELVVNEDSQYFIAKIDTIKSKYKLKILAGNQIHIDMNLNLYGYISESKLPLTAQQLPYYNKLLENETKKKVTAFITEMLDAEYDPIGFGLKYKAMTLHNKRMSNSEWDEAYKNAKVNITVTSNLKSTGSIQ